MLSLATRHQLFIGAILALLVVATRGQHFATLHSLPGASWAVLFLAGLYLRPVWALPGFLALTWALDFAAYAWGGASGFCITPAYGFLLPAYSALWLAGRWYAERYRFQWSSLLALGAAALSGTAVCELLSSGGFYFFSGRFAEPTLAEFAMRFAKYFPHDVQSVAFYIGFAALVHTLFSLVRHASRHRTATEV